jgi:hypothetical protein
MVAEASCAAQLSLAELRDGQTTEQLNHESIGRINHTFHGLIDPSPQSSMSLRPPPLEEWNDVVGGLHRVLLH